MNIYDNFLPLKDFENIQNFIMSGEIDWYLQPNIVDETEESSLSINFTHLFYGQDQPVDAEGLNILVPLIERLNSVSLIRLKANAYPNTSTIVEHEFHTDLMNHHVANLQTCLFHINSNDGYTKFGNDSGYTKMDAMYTKVESVENRLVFFDSNIPHASTSCTNSKIRYNLNINYFSESDPTPSKLL